MNAGWYRWAVVAMLWLVCLFNYADRQAITAVFKPMQAEMNLDDVQVGVVGGAFMWVYSAALPLAGLIGDRVNRKLLILGGLGFWSVVTLATAWAQTYWQLVLFRALEGLGEAFYFPASMSLIGDYHGPGTRSRAMGFHQSSVYAGTILGSTVAGFFGQHYGWRSGFYLFGGLGVLLAVVLLLALREPTRETSEVPAEPSFSYAELLAAVSEVARNRAVWLLVAVFIGANFVAAVILVWMPTFLGRKFDMDLTSSGLNATIWLQTASIPGVFVGGWLADRWSWLRGGRMIVQATGLLVGAPLIFLIGWATSLRVVLLAMCGLGFFKGLYDASLWAGLFDVVRPERRATAQGLMNSIGWLGAGTAPVIIGAASEHYGMSACVSATSMVYLFSGTLLLFGITLLPRSAPNTDESSPAPAEEVGLP
jgi:MFS family permease